MAPAASDGDAEIWVPVTINLPLGLAKSWTPDSCVPSNLLCGPFAVIFFAVVFFAGVFFAVVFFAVACKESSGVR